MVAQLPQRAEVIQLADSGFAKKSQKEGRPLCLSDFEASREFLEARKYIRNLLKNALKGQIGSPIFQYVIDEDMDELNIGSKKWVGIIPREITAEATQAFAEEATEKILAFEKNRLKLKDNEPDSIRPLIRNTLIAILHDNLKRVPEAPALNVALNGEEEFQSYQTLETAVSEANEFLVGTRMNDSNYDQALVKLLKTMGTLKSDASAKEIKETLLFLERVKNKAWDLYKRLDENIKKAQRLAKIPGPRAKVDLNTDHSSLHLFELIRSTYGLSEDHGQTEEDRYELQIAGHLTWLLARLETHPIYKTLMENYNKVISDFNQRVYHESFIFKKNPVKKKMYYNEKMRPIKEGVAHYTDELEVYDSTTEDFDDLSPEQKQIWRGNFRPKESLSFLVKTIEDRQELSHIADALAGEAVMTGINEQDLDPEKNPNAERLQAYMEAEAEAIGASQGLKKAPAGCPYDKIPRGTYKIVPKFKKAKNPHSFNFPAVKIYFNMPVGKDRTSEVGPSIRSEYRLLCNDTWTRANMEEDSMSYHEMYKMKQGVDMLDIFTARAYNDTIHPVAKEFRKWVKRKERREIREIRKAA